MKNRKGFLQVSFPWLFAIIVGSIILFLAIFAVTKIFQTEQATATAVAGKEIGILLNPLETSFESSVTTPLSIPVESRIFNKCNNIGEFGRQIIQVEQKNFGKFTETDIDVGFSNKYIFSENFVQGRQFYLFSKSFEFPFEVTDLIYLTSAEQNYCFLTAPENIKQEIEDLNQPNLLIENCAGNSNIINICFDANNCEINVNYNSGYVEKQGNKLYFETDALMYAAIFSEQEIYECQVKRVIQRLENLARLYKDKSVILAKQGCTSELNSGIIMLENSAGNFEDSSDISSMENIVETLENKNDFARCRLW